MIVPPVDFRIEEGILNGQIKVKLPSAEPISKKLKPSFDTLVENNKLLLTKFEYLYPSEND